MEKLSHTTESIIDENVEKLAGLFPEVVTEVREPDGSLRHTIDVDALRERVGDVAEGQRERYQFTWPGKREAKQEAYRQIDKCLRPCPEESVNWDTTQNLYIEGDNLDALKLLRNTYAGKVKMIYIDPPYNTGHDFIYDDDFARSKAEYDAESGDYDEEGGRLVANPESNGRFHSDWCSMMYPRLLLARDLLSEDGVIFISIDEKEHANLRRICDDVFGESNRLNTIIWRYTSGGIPESGKFSAKHDTILLYAKFNGRQNISIPFEKSYSKTIPEPHTESGMRLGVKRDDKCEFCGGHPGAKYRQVVMRDVWTDINSLFRNNFEKKILEEMGVSFDTQKPIMLIERMLKTATNEGDLILDFFSGSATTAHAVMNLSASSEQNRHFILVQLPEPCDEKSETTKVGYKNICEIGKERIRRAGRKIVSEVEESNRQLKLGEERRKVPDIGFRVLKIDSSNFEDIAMEPDKLSQDAMLEHADNLKFDRTPDDLIIQVMLEKQIELSASIEKLDIDGHMVFSVDGGRLVACFDRDVSVEVMMAMAKMTPEPDYAVMRDASFAGDDAVSNFAEIFKNYSPVTEVEVI